MANDTSHLYLTIKWKGTGAARSGETAQIGIRIGAYREGGPTNPGVPTANDGRVSFDLWEAAVATATLTTENLVIDKGHNLSASGAPLQVQTDQDIQDLCEASWTAASAFSAWVPSYWTLEHIKIAPIGQMGKYPATTAAATIATPKVAMPGRGDGGSVAQVAACVTLGTRLRGKGSSGRIYVPFGRNGSNIGLTSGGLIDTPAVDSLKTTAKNWFDQINGTSNPSVNYRVMLVQRASLTAPSIADHRGTVVNHVRVGNEPDIQQRRRNATPETFTRADLDL